MCALVFFLGLACTLTVLKNFTHPRTKELIPWTHSHLRTFMVLPFSRDPFLQILFLAELWAWPNSYPWPFLPLQTVWRKFPRLVGAGGDKSPVWNSHFRLPLPLLERAWHSILQDTPPVEICLVSGPWPSMIFHESITTHVPSLHASLVGFH